MLTNLPKRSPVIESFRTLRTNIKFAGVDEEIKTILVTSSGPMEGKSLTVANLAACLALSKVRTLIIDTDLRRPRLHAMFGQEKEPGLSDLLTDEKLDEDGRRGKEGWMEDELISNNEFIRKTDIDNLYLLPRGTRPPNPTELLGSKRLRQLMEKLREQFDIIIFDSPPLVAVTDATVIASELADTVLLVVEAGVTKRELGIRAKELLEKVDANIFGVVLNNLDYTKRYGSYYYYYYYHYHYYYSQEEEE